MTRDRILIVDDDPNMLLLLEFNLRQRGLEVETLADGSCAVERALSRDYALIILDVMMPGLTGFEICEKLRAEPRTEEVPILLVTARARWKDHTKGLQVGATEYITKPFDPIVFAEKVVDYVNRASREAR